MHKNFLSLVSGFFLFPLLLLQTVNCFALQSIAIGDNQTKKVTISGHELSRIFVKGDRIVSVRGVEGAYILTKDVVQGQIFIKPATSYQARPFNLFISTEQGRNFNLVVSTSGALGEGDADVSGQDIELKPTSPSKKAAVWEKTSEYSQSLTKLITGMINEEAPAGYSVVYPNRKESKKVKYDDFIIKPLKQYVGAKMYGEVLHIQNKRKHSVNLTESMFYQEGTRAIALLHQNLPPRGQTVLVRVMSGVRDE